MVSGPPIGQQKWEGEKQGLCVDSGGPNLIRSHSDGSLYEDIQTLVFFFCLFVF